MKLPFFSLAISSLLLSACITRPPIEQEAMAYATTVQQQQRVGESVIDRQERMFRERLQSSSIGIERTGDQIRLTMPDTITFEINKAILNPEVKYSLDEMAAVLDEYNQSRIDISGHTDSTGNDAINNPLSQRRANAVARYLKQRGVSGSRIRAVGYGSYRPILSNATPEGRAVNRRVEILITQ